MIEEHNCIKNTPCETNVYGEFQSKLISSTQYSDESKLPYELLLERKYLNDIMVKDERFNVGDSVLQKPVGLPIQEILDKVTSIIDKSSEVINNILNKILNNTQIATDEVGGIGTTDRDLKQMIKFIKWHPQFKILAVVNRNDVVYIYNFQNIDGNSNNIGSLLCEPLSLWFELQSNIKDIQWKLNYPLTLALASDNGIIIWEIDFEDFEPINSNTNSSNNINNFKLNSKFKLKSSKTSSNILNYPCLIPNTISWSRDGLKLVAGSRNVSSILVWDLPSRVPTFVPRYNCNSLLSFNHSGDLLLSCSSKDSFRIYNVSNWLFEGKEWPQLSTFQTSCWSPTGKYLCVASSDKLTFIQCEDNPLDTNGQLLYIERTTQGVDNIGGHIKNVQWSPDGQRLAVTFYRSMKTEYNDRIVAIYRVKTYPKFELSPRGFLRKQNSTSISSISFLPNYHKGSLLSVAYSDGVISFFPLIYKHKLQEVSYD